MTSPARPITRSGPVSFRPWTPAGSSDEPTTEDWATEAVDGSAVAGAERVAGDADHAAGVRAGQATDRGLVRIEAHGSEPAEFVHQVGGLCDGHGWTARPTDGPFAYRYTALGDAALTLHRAQVDGAVRGTVRRTDDYVVQWLPAARPTSVARVDQAAVPVGVPVLLPPDRGFAFDFRDFDQRAVHLSRALVADVAAERFGTGHVSELGLDRLRPLDPLALVRWRDHLRLLVDELRGGAGSVLWQTLSRGAAAAFLDLYPPTVPALPPALLTPKRARLRSAVEYVRHHAHEAVSVGDIAAAAGLSVRSVQEGFVRDLGRTPMTYLQEVRLEHTREELLAADHRETAVQDVARRWGFGHMGRFSAAYHRAFGEFPRETLRR